MILKVWRSLFWGFQSVSGRAWESLSLAWHRFEFLESRVGEGTWQGRELPARPRGASQGHHGSSRPILRERVLAEVHTLQRVPNPIRAVSVAIPTEVPPQRQYLWACLLSLALRTSWISGAGFWKLFHRGFHPGPLPSQHLWWEKHSQRTTAILQRDRDENSPAGSLSPVGPSPAWHKEARSGAPLSEGGTQGGETERKWRKQLEWSKQNFRPGDPKQTVGHICLLSLLPGNTAALFHVVYQWRLVFRTPEKIFLFLFFKLYKTFLLSFKGR